jgi:hypothetical protein
MDARLTDSMEAWLSNPEIAIKKIDIDPEYSEIVYTKYNYNLRKINTIFTLAFIDCPRSGTSIEIKAQIIGIPGRITELHEQLLSRKSTRFTADRLKLFNVIITSINVKFN